MIFQEKTNNHSVANTKPIKSFGLNVILAGFLFCAVSLSAHAQTESEANNAIIEAQSLWDESIAAGHEWNTIKPLVAQAKQAFRAKDFATAISLAKEASAQSKEALVQAEYEKTNWVNNLPK
ncbi:MAG: hypothetical protein ABGX64_04690 [Cycloclasticus sp.]|jgi:hypothetical protein